MPRGQSDFLKGLRVASPCPESWENMTGDERVRSCARCQLNVYNLHELTMSEVEALFSGPKGRVCIRMYRRKDGTVITQDCPVGLRKVRMRLVASVSAAAAFAGAAVMSLLQVGAQERWAIRFRTHAEELRSRLVPAAHSELPGYTDGELLHKKARVGIGEGMVY